MERAKKPAISLNHKVIVALFFVILFYALLDSFLHHRLITPNFTALEEREAKASITRCISYLKQELEKLARQNYEWSSRDETYNFVSFGDPSFVNRNLAGTYLDNSGLDLMYFHSDQGRLIWGETRDPDGGRVENIPSEVNAALDYFASESNGSNDLNGIVAAENYPILLSIKPVLNLTGSGPRLGSVTVGRYLDEITLATISNYTLTNLSFIQTGDPGLPEKLKYVQRKLTDKNRYFFRKSRDSLSLFTYFHDIYGEREFLLAISNNREIISKARDVEKSAFNSVMIIGLIILISIFILLTIIVISPLNNLTRYIRILQAEDYKAPVSIDILHSDEIAVLTYEFNRLVNKLAESRKKLLVQSYYAGIGESSSIILHNIRNTLNPIIVNVDLLRLSLKEISLEHLRKAMSEYTDPDTDQERHQAIEEYLNLAVDRLSDIFSNFHMRLDQMIVQSGRIENILANQKKFSHIKPPIEQIEVLEVIYDSIDRISKGESDKVDIKIDPAIKGCGVIEVERINLMQVLEHVLTNCCEAIQAAGISDGKINITGRTLEDNPDQVILEISDNGIGVHADHLTEIFQRDYTTKSDKAAGFGLHWCATTLNAMGGRIWIDSRGKGTGATIYIKLPRFRDIK